jgi:hypothetical protein
VGKKSVYKHLTEGEWERPLHRGYRLACCHCGLVHKVDFRIVNREVQFRVHIDERATAAMRRPFKFPKEEN